IGEGSPIRFDMADISWLTLKFTQKELAAIGEVAVESAQLEVLLDHLLGNLAEVDTRTSDILMGRVMFARKLAIVEKLIANRLGKDGTKDTKLLAESRAIISRIEKLAEDRAVAIHGLWITHTVQDGQKGARAPKALSTRRRQPVRKEITI